MKIAYVVPYNWGGMIHYTAELANAVAENADVFVLGSKNIPKHYFSENINIFPIFDDLDFSMSDLKTVISYNNLKAILSFRRIRILKRLNLDLIHFTTPLMHIPLFILLYGINKNCPLIKTVHSPHQENNYLVEKIYYLDCLIDNLLPYKRVIVHSQRDKEEIMREKDSPEKDIAVIPHGTYDFFNKYVNIDNSRTNPEKNSIIFFGYIKKYKGLEYLLQAIPYISKDIPDINLIIAGEGDFSPYNSMIDKYDPSIYDHIEVHNRFISDQEVSVLFQRASIVILPYSQMTGQSGVITIAHAFGKPIVATNVWAFHEVLEDGKTGFLVPPKDPKSLAQAIIKILKDADLKSFMEANSIKKAKELSWNNIANKHIELYKEIINLPR